MKKLLIAVAVFLPLIANAATQSAPSYSDQMNERIDQIAEQTAREYEHSRQERIKVREAQERKQQEVLASAMLAADAKLRAKEGLPPRSEQVDNRTVSEKLAESDRAFAASMSAPPQVAQAATRNNAEPVDGYTSPDSAYVRACVKDARDKIKVIGTVYSTAAGYDYPADADSVQPTFPKAFRNPVRTEQFIHPIEFKQTFVRGFPTRVRVMYSSATKNDPNSCVFQGIEFLDQTDAN